MGWFYSSGWFHVCVWFHVTVLCLCLVETTIIAMITISVRPRIWGPPAFRYNHPFPFGSPADHASRLFVTYLVKAMMTVTHEMRGMVFCTWLKRWMYCLDVQDNLCGFPLCSTVGQTWRPMPLQCGSFATNGMGGISILPLPLSF